MEEQLRRSASFAHELLMMNLAIFHLLLPVAALSTGHIALFMSLSALGSVMIITWIAMRARKESIIGDFVAAHWALARKRCRLLLIGYTVAAGIMFLGWLLTLTHTDANMQTIQLVVFSRIAAVPVVLIVLALFVMETTALSQARQNELP